MRTDIHASSTEETDLAAHTSLATFRPRSVKRPSVETERRICSHGEEADECLACAAESAGEYADMPTLASAT